MYLVFDTETSNFPNPSLAVNHPDQGRIVQLAWLLLDAEFKEVGAFNSLIHIGEQVNIAAGAAKAHGITKEKCWQYGVEMPFALRTFLDVYKKAEVVIAHNIAFDKQLVDLEEKAAFQCSTLDWKKGKCTMLATTPICKLIGKYPGKYKWPKLIEAYRHCFQKDFDGAHDALADVRATAAVFKWLVENGHKV